jgi:hypothetical protein
VALSYDEFLARKRRTAVDAVVNGADAVIHPSLFPFQRDIVRWALRKGRAACFADTGLGKTRIAVEWARLSGQRCLMLAPLAVTHQTIREAARIGVDVIYARHQGEAASTGITITNYERLDRFDPAAFGAVVLDESGILKAFSGVTKKALITAFRQTPWRLCCSATPAPNDIEELCNHADFLGAMSPQEMRSTFFIADSRGEFMRYRLKRHAHSAFYRWLSSWAIAVKRPSDLGYDDGAFLLPGLDILPHFVATDYRPPDRLFALDVRGIGDASAIRWQTLEERVDLVVQLVEAEPAEPWLLWCGLNEEGRALGRRIPGAVVVEGADPPDQKAQALLDFAEGRTRVLVTKAGIAGWGMNFQRCARMAFVGLGYSYELYYQALRRCHRFGQTRRVIAHIVLSEPERDILAAVQQKERQADSWTGGLLSGMREFTRAEIFAGTSAGDAYEPSRPLTLPAWLEGAG